MQFTTTNIGIKKQADDHDKEEAKEKKRKRKEKEEEEVKYVFSIGLQSGFIGFF
jgi:ATP-dependent Clp protease ATP-binding subunit ClpA